MNHLFKARKAIVVLAALLIAALTVSCGGKSGDETAAASDRAASSVSKSNAQATPSAVSEAESDEEEVAETPEEAAESQVTEEAETPEPEDEDGISRELRDRMNILNYMTFLTQEINTEPVNPVYIEEAYDFYDNLNRAVVDVKMGEWVDSLWNAIKDYRLIEEGRHLLQVAYDQRRAESIKAAIPNPANLLNSVKSGDLVSNFISSAGTAFQTLIGNSTTDQEYLRDSWKLSEEQQEKLHESLKDSFHRAIDMAKEYEVPEEYLLRDEDLKAFIDWSAKLDEDTPEKLSWLENHQDVYMYFCPYWLELAESCYAHEEYEKCLEAVRKYEAIASPIFLKDKDYANVLPIKVDSAKKSLTEAEYEALAAEACTAIMENTDDEDWSLRYIAATTLYDLYSATNDKAYLEQAYQAIYDNVVICVGEQREQNAAYLEDVKEEPTPENATEEEKKSIKEYNKELKANRKTELPPVYAPLYVNGSMLLKLAEELGVDAAEQKKIETLLHKDGERIILAENIDELLWADNGPTRQAVNNVEVTLEPGVFTIPASYLTDQFVVTATVEGNGEVVTCDDWSISEVKREKGAEECSEFTAYLESKKCKDYKYEDGDKVTIEVTPMKDAPVEPMTFVFNAVSGKKLLIFDDITFEREL